MGISLKVQNEQIRRLTKIEDVIKCITKATWQEVGHEVRGDQE